MHFSKHFVYACVLTSSLSAASVLGASVASAQEEASASASVSASGTKAKTASSTDSSSISYGDSDHAKFIGTFAVGYLGASAIPIATDVSIEGTPGSGVTLMSAKSDSVTAPVVGVRYWLNEQIGLDVGLGIRSYSGKVKRRVADYTPAGAQSPAELDWETDKVNQTGFMLHAGVPIALDAEKHYVFEVIPEANLGFSSGTIKDQPYVPQGQTNPTVTTGDIKLSGYRFDIGARAGAELHFGFIGVPNLSLQAGVGLYLSMERFKADGGARPPATSGGSAMQGRPNTTYQDSTTTISTSVNGQPWAIFTNNISALYYF